MLVCGYQSVALKSSSSALSSTREQVEELRDEKEKKNIISPPPVYSKCRYRNGEGRPGKRASPCSNPVIPRMEKTPFVGKATVRYMITRLLKPALSWYARGRWAERKMQPGKYSLRN